MLVVTDKAAAYMRESLSHREEGAPDALRIVYSDSEGYQLTLDSPRDGDQMFERDGHSFLVLDPEIGEALSDATLDVQESPHGASLALTARGTPAVSAASSAAAAGGEARPEKEAEEQP